MTGTAADEQAGLSRSRATNLGIRIVTSTGTLQAETCKGGDGAGARQAVVLSITCCGEHAPVGATSSSASACWAVISTQSLWAAWRWLVATTSHRPPIGRRRTSAITMRRKICNGLEWGKKANSGYDRNTITVSGAGATNMINPPRHRSTETRRRRRRRRARAATNPLRRRPTFRRYAYVAGTTVVCVVTMQQPAGVM